MSRTPLSKQRNKYIQRVLVEAPSWRPGRTTIWPWFMKQRTRKGMAIEPRLPELGRWSRICSPWIGDNGISCLRKLTGAQLHRNRRLRKRQDYTALRPPGPASCRLSDEDQTPEVLSELFQDWQRTHTQSSVMVPRDLRQRMDVRFCEGRNHRRKAQVRAADPGRFAARSSKTRLRRSVFSLDKDLIWRSATRSKNGGKIACQSARMANISAKIVVLGPAISVCCSEVKAQQQDPNVPPVLPTLSPPSPPWILVHTRIPFSASL